MKFGLLVVNAWYVCFDAALSLEGGASASSATCLGTGYSTRSPRPSWAS